MNTSAHIAPSSARPAALSGLTRQIAAALLLGLVVVYGVEFSDASVGHNAAHDVRHANGRPCH